MTCEEGGAVALLTLVFCRMVGCSILGPLGGGTVPMRICDRLNVIAVNWAVTRYVVDIQIYEETT